MNLQYAQFFRRLKRGIFDKIRSSQWLQGMVLDGLKWFQAKNWKSMTFNYKSTDKYLVLALLGKGPGSGTTLLVSVQEKDLILANYIQLV